MRPRITNPRRGNAIQAVYPMKYSMLIKCDKCGYENFPQHRFCGMCAAELSIPQGPLAGAVARVPQPAAAPRPAIRPAVAKAEHAPVDARSVSYLLDDEPPPSRSGRYVWLLVLLLVGAAAAWHWRGELESVVARISNGSAGTPGQPNASAPSAPSSSADAAPATPAGVSPEAKAPNTGTDASGAEAQQSSSPVPTAGDSAQSPPDQSAPSKPEQQGDAQQTPDAVAAQPTRASKPQARSAPASATSVEDLEAEGEKYLYGNGVPENCGQARKNLLAAAGHSSAKAQNVLGTMYATGHCATRDLPTAYRWFGRSLRQDPGNTRIVQDLKVLWNQMTPEERQVALRNHR